MYDDSSPSCNDCGMEIPAADIAGPDGTIALTAEVTHRLFADYQPKRVAA